MLCEGALMRNTTVALALLALAACEKECDKGVLRCDGNVLQICIDPAGGGELEWRDVADCGEEKLLGVSIGACYDCKDGTSLCAVVGEEACFGHDGVL
jgi:hypothetical protein